MKRLSTWSKRFIIIGLFSVFLLFLLFCADVYITASLENQLITSLEDIANQNVLLIQSKIDERFDLVTGIAKEFYGDTPIDYENSHLYTHELSEMFNFRKLGLASPDGTAYVSSNEVFTVSQRTYFQKSIAGQNYVSELLLSLSDQAEINVYSVPIFDSSKQVKAVLFAVYDAVDFQDCLKISCFNGNGYSYIINQNGDVITDSPSVKASAFSSTNIEQMIDMDARNQSAVSTMLNGMKTNTPGCVQYNYDGDKYAYFTNLNVNDWWLVTVVPSFVLQRRISPLLNITHFIGGSVFFAGLISFVYMLRKHEKYQKHLQRIAYIDSFTGLYSKAYLKEHLQTLLGKQSAQNSALVIYNIRKFKIVNEIYGTLLGNQILQQFAQVLQQSVNPTCEIVIHDHADEFAVLYSYDSIESLQQRIHKIIQTAQCLECSSNQIRLNLAVGVYSIQNNKDSFEKIYHCANIAAKKNKQNKAGQVTYYSEDLSETEAQRKLSEDAIRIGIQNKEFKAWFQPKYNAITKEVIGCEALARWYKPDGSVLPPYHFVPLSETVGIISEIDELIFEDVCYNLSQWLKQGLLCVPVSVNLSRAYLGNPNYLARLQEIVQSYEIPNKYIHLEITESAITDNEQMLNQMIEKMHELGFTVLLDDFGVGYSSLTSINSLNFDVLKIDKSFVDSIGTQTGDCIVQYTIALGQNLGMGIVAEGVETQAQYEFLKQHGCQTIQGYYFSKPLSCKDFTQLLSPSNHM